ncbi:MAG: LysM peptidoglycan-binding domain-containing protein [Desulfobacteraceae bacterium]|jgi:tetratricopeptide (TPR) repeat protein|nr:LysM peptidoglycan-binding domain-containing protein [Desulfobacteraceae bacterium]
MKTTLPVSFLCLMIAVLAGCATGGGAAATDNRSVPAKAYYDEGLAQEQAGRVVEATRMFKLALTLTPENGEIASALARVEATRQAMAEERFQQGERDYAGGKYQDSKIAYLSALRLWPEHAGALERLRAREKITVTHEGKHVVQKGETLAIIAKKYYGDYKKFNMIAQYNRLADATQIEVGQVIMIPEIGMGSPPVATSDTANKDDQRLAEAAEATISQAVAIQVDNYRDAGKEMLQAGDYGAAIVEYQKVLNVIPDDPEARQDIAAAHNAYGRQLWDRQEIDQARQQFEACIAFRDGCQACRDVVADCEKTYKERLYNRGIAFFQDEKPEAALSEWQIVQALDPGYRNVADYIQKAKKISEQLGKLKQGQSSP